MSKLAYFVFAVILTASLSVASAQDQPRSKQSPSAPATPSTEQEVKTFTGKIMKAGEKYVFEDASSKVTYELDDQNKAKPYEGQKVKVTGTLDATNNTIHISNIESA